MKIRTVLFVDDDETILRSLERGLLDESCIPTNQLSSSFLNQGCFPPERSLHALPIKYYTNSESLAAYFII